MQKYALYILQYRVYIASIQYGRISWVPLKWAYAAPDPSAWQGQKLVNLLFFSKQATVQVQYVDITGIYSASLEKYRPSSNPLNF